MYLVLMFVLLKHFQRLLDYYGRQVIELLLIVYVFFIFEYYDDICAFAAIKGYVLEIYRLTTQNLHTV